MKELNYIETEIKNGLNKYYRKSNNLTIRNRYKGLSQVFKNIINYIN